MKFYLNKELKALFYKFDLANKGYLNATEFECFCYCILKAPPKDKDTSKVYLSDIQDYEQYEDDLRGLFFRISDKDDKLTKERLKEKCDEINYPIEKYKILEKSFPVKGFLGLEDFERIFK